MNILIVSRLFHPCVDAIGRELSEIATQLDKKEQKVTVLCMHVAGENQKKEFWNNIEIVRLGVFKNSNMKNHLSEFILFIIKARLWLIRNHRKYDVIYFDGLWPSGLISYRFKTKAKVFFQSNGKDMPGYDKNLDFFYKILIPVIKRNVENSSGLIMHSKHQIRLAEKVFNPQKFIFIPNGTDDEIFNYSQIDNIKEKIILYLGRFEPVKGIHECLELIKKINTSPEFPIDWSFCIAGIGTFEHDVIELTKTYGNISYVGYVTGKDKFNMLSKASVFILPSRSESGPRTVSEAMAVGCAIVSTDVGDVEFKLGTDGCIFFDLENIDDAAKSIISLVTDPEKLSFYQNTAKTRVAKLPTWNSVTDQYLSVFKNN